MKTQAQELAERFKALNEQVIAFVKTVPETKWRNICEDEDWPLGVVARHIGAGHYSTIEIAKMIIAGDAVPEFTKEQIIAGGNAHAAKHAECTKEEVLSILKAKGQKLFDYVSRLSDTDLECSAVIQGFGGKISVKQLLKATNLGSAGQHLESMRKALAN